MYGFILTLSPRSHKALLCVILGISSAKLCGAALTSSSAFQKCWLIVDFPAQDPPLVSNCLRSSMETGSLHDFANRGTFYQGTAWGSFNTVLANSLLLTWSGMAQRTRWAPLKSENPEEEAASTDKIDVYTDKALVEWGRPSHHHHRFLLGRSALPFGLNDSPLAEIAKTKQILLFEGPTQPILMYTLDNLSDLLIQFAVNPFLNHKQTSEKVSSEAHHQDFSLRMVGDLPTMGVTRIILSFLSGPNPNRQVGLALINRNFQDEEFSFEYSRLFPVDDLSGGEMMQLFRLTYLGGRPEVGQLKIQYDDLRLRYRQGWVGYKLPLWTGFISLEGGVGFSQSSSELWGKSGWSLFLNISGRV